MTTAGTAQLRNWMLSYQVDDDGSSSLAASKREGIGIMLREVDADTFTQTPIADRDDNTTVSVGGRLVIVNFSSAIYRWLSPPFDAPQRRKSDPRSREDNDLRDDVRAAVARAAVAPIFSPIVIPQREMFGKVRFTPEQIAAAPLSALADENYRRAVEETFGAGYPGIERSSSPAFAIPPGAFGTLFPPARPRREQPAIATGPRRYFDE